MSMDDSEVELTHNDSQAKAQPTDLDGILKRLEGGGATVHRMKVKENSTFALTAKELRTCCDKNASHPHATIFRNAVAGHMPDDEVVVDRVDLEALLKNKKVKVIPEQSTEVIDGQQTLVTTERKELTD